jgi:hypothetical protein
MLFLSFRVVTFEIYRALSCIDRWDTLHQHSQHTLAALCMPTKDYLSARLPKIFRHLPRAKPNTYYLLEPEALGGANELERTY